MRILIFSGLSDKKLLSKISPIAALEKVDKIYLIRNYPLDHQKVISLKLPSYLKIPFIREIVKILYGCFITLFKKIDYIIGIYLLSHGFIAFLVGKIFNKPTIQLLIGDEMDVLDKHPKIQKKLLKSAKYIGVRGNRSKKRLRETTEKENNIFIHHNVYSPLIQSQEKTAYSKEFDIISVGDFDPCKRIDIFLRVISKIKKQQPKISAALVGKVLHNRRIHYQKMCMELGLSSNVKFMGHVKDVFPFLLRSRIFLMTSQTEGLPMSMIEAMSMGLPCVVPDVGDIKDVADDGMSALVAKPLDVNDFALKVTRLLEDQTLYEKISKNAKKTIKEKSKEFSLQNIKEGWGKILV